MDNKNDNFNKESKGRDLYSKKHERINTDRIISFEGYTIGRNIRKLRKSKRIGQTELVAWLQLREVPITRETLVKIEGGRQHIKLTQLRGIRDVLRVSYEDILDS